MANRSSMTHQATLMLLLLNWRGNEFFSNGLTVDPPENIVILDPGHLGHLDITWSPPASLINMKGCQPRYQLEYFNAYKDTWTAIRTSRTSYSAQFDMMKDIKVRIHTLLSGSCTNGTMMKSANYTELVQKPPSTGLVDTTVKDFSCVFQNMETMKCKWERNPAMPANSQLNLYFWHKELEQVEECPKYIISGGFRSGCDFTEKLLPDFTDINLCINGSSPKGPLKSLFISLQIQDHVKPGTVGKVHLRTGPDEQLEIFWDHPVGKVPRSCLEWEVEHSEQKRDEKTATHQILTRQMSLTLSLAHNTERHCFRVRSKLSKYCADKGFWSEWSQPTCHPALALDMKVVAPEPQKDMFTVYVYIAVAIIAILVLSLCVGTALKVRRLRNEKPHSLLSKLFTGNIGVRLTEV